jgi:hypothetical protein
MIQVLGQKKKFQFQFFRDKYTDRTILVVASGANRVDLKKIEAATGHGEPL